YVLVNRKFRFSVQVERARRGATGGIGTDHHLLRAKIRLHLKCRRKTEKKYRLRLDQSKPTDNCLVSAFQIDLANENKGIRRDNNTLSVNEKFANFVNSVLERVYGGQHEYWEELSIDIENAVKVHDPTTAFQIIRRLRGNGQSITHIPVHDTNGLTLTNSKDQLNRWKEYFDEMLNVDTTINEQILQQIPSPTAVGQIKNKKAPGKDDVPVELLKAGSHYIAEWLHEIIRDVWEQEVTVKEWTEAIIIRLYKNKGDKRICDNYRGISLLDVAAKIFARIIQNRIQASLDR
ncbi:unnamed protein product, partial [Rotaria magnacalcarata]